jgi:hypothetical protein
VAESRIAEEQDRTLERAQKAGTLRSELKSAVARADELRRRQTDLRVRERQR